MEFRGIPFRSVPFRPKRPEFRYKLNYGDNACSYRFHWHPQLHGRSVSAAPADKENAPAQVISLVGMSAESLRAAACSRGVRAGVEIQVVGHQCLEKWNGEKIYGPVPLHAKGPVSGTTSVRSAVCSRSPKQAQTERTQCLVKTL